MAEQQYLIPQSDAEVDPQLRADIDEILADAYAEYGEIDTRFAEVSQIGLEINGLHAYAVQHPEIIENV